MIDPITAFATAQAAIKGVQAAIKMGKDIGAISGDLMKFFEAKDIVAKAAVQPKKASFGKSDTAQAFETVMHAKQLQDAILKYPQIKYQSSADISIAKPATNQSITDLYSKIKEKGGYVKRKDMMDWGFNDSFIRQYGGVKKINEAALGTITIDT
jgi:hypothetical protein